MIAISQKYKNIYNHYICFSKYIFYCDTYIYILIYQLERKKVPYIFICFIYIYIHTEESIISQVYWKIHITTMNRKNTSSSSLLPNNHWSMLTDAEKGAIILKEYCSLEKYNIIISNLHFVQLMADGPVFFHTENLNYNNLFWNNNNHYFPHTSHQQQDENNCKNNALAVNNVFIKINVNSNDINIDKAQRGQDVVTTYDSFNFMGKIFYTKTVCSKGCKEYVSIEFKEIIGFQNIQNNNSVNNNNISTNNNNIYSFHQQNDQMHVDMKVFDNYNAASPSSIDLQIGNNKLKTLQLSNNYNNINSTNNKRRFSDVIQPTTVVVEKKRLKIL